LCEAPFGPFRQKVPDTFSAPAQHITIHCQERAADRRPCVGLAGAASAVRDGCRLLRVLTHPQDARRHRLDVLRRDEEPRPTVADDVRHTADVRRDDAQPRRERLQHRYGHVVDIGRIQGHVAAVVEFGHLRVGDAAEEPDAVDAAFRDEAFEGRPLGPVAGDGERGGGASGADAFERANRQGDVVPRLQMPRDEEVRHPRDPRPIPESADVRDVRHGRRGDVELGEDVPEEAGRDGDAVGAAQPSQRPRPTLEEDAGITAPEVDHDRPPPQAGSGDGGHREEVVVEVRAGEDVEEVHAGRRRREALQEQDGDDCRSQAAHAPQRPQRPRPPRIRRHQQDAPAVGAEQFRQPLRLDRHPTRRRRERPHQTDAVGSAECGVRSMECAVGSGQPFICIAAQSGRRTVELRTAHWIHSARAVKRAAWARAIGAVPSRSAAR